MSNLDILLAHDRIAWLDREASAVPLQGTRARKRRVTRRFENRNGRMLRTADRPRYVDRIGQRLA